MKRSSKAHADGRFAKNFYGPQGGPSSHERIADAILSGLCSGNALAAILHEVFVPAALT